jgi:hypothetical protein
VPILKARPAFADELGETLEPRQQARAVALSRTYLTRRAIRPSPAVSPTPFVIGFLLINPVG